MINKPQLAELYRHMDWADAVIWNAVLHNVTAAGDVAIKARLFHIHYAQYAYLQQWKGLDFERLKEDDFDSLQDVKAWMQPHYLELHTVLHATPEDALSGPMSLPWAKYYGRQMGITPEDTTLGETMLHLGYHGIHHRAQVNTQLREHGETPPLIDYIAWIWQGRPDAAWP